LRLVTACVAIPQSLGKTHPQAQEIRKDYANLLRTIGQEKEAKELEENAL
jgi:hypothetical protein